MADQPSQRAGRLVLSRRSMAALAFLAIAGFFLLSEHRAHAFGLLPYLLLLACPLLHFLHHGGHKGPSSGANHKGHSPRDA